MRYRFIAGLLLVTVVIAAVYLQNKLARPKPTSQVTVETPVKPAPVVVKARVMAPADIPVKPIGPILMRAEDQGFVDSPEVLEQLALAESLMIAGSAQEAVGILQPLVEQFPISLAVRLQTGKAYLLLFRTDQMPEHFNGTIENLAAVVTYYNTRPEKPDQYWDAWLHICYLHEAHGGDKAKQIPKNARILKHVDENLGGPDFKERFTEVFNRN